jgi:aryl-alcohol dehydrogenase-like predicted oxidoreductase
MKEHTLGPLNVSALGLGCMGMSYAYGPADDSESLAVLRRYFELGGNFLDTAEIYGPYKNEELSAAFREIRASERLLRRSGFRIVGRGNHGADSSPSNVRRA